MSEKVIESSSESIQVLVVIDTEYVKAHYPNPSKDPNAPTGIDHNSQFMIANDPRGVISGQGTADLNFKANAGDFVSFAGTSIYANADDAVIVYDIQYWQKDRVFNHFVPNLVTRKKAVMPDPDSNNGLPAIQAPIIFSTLDSRVRQSGTEDFYVKFALYTLDPKDGDSQVLFGYYYWDPTITVGQG